MTNSSSNSSKSMDDLLSNPFELQPEPLQSTVNPLEQKAPSVLERLPEEDQKKAKQLSEQIPVGNYESILTYGANAQTELSRFSHQMLDHVQRKDIGPVGDVLKDLMDKLNELDPEELQKGEKSGIRKFFGRVSRSLQELMTKYQKLSTQIDRIGIQLEHSKTGLVEDVHMLDQLYEQNKTYFQALNIYIAAAELKKEEIVSKMLPELKQKAEASQDQMDVQEFNDLAQFVDRLEKRVYDLQLSRQITIQTAPQIRMIQQTNQTLAEKIQSSIMTAIPLWKNQIAIALTLNNQRKAVEAQKQVTKTTNDLLLKNSEMLKVNTIETAKENERGLVEIETLKKTQENLISTIEETLQIQADGRQKRKAAEIEIARMEEDLKQRLLSIHTKHQERSPY
ncbi:toxic anion resistance protein [Rummeliibacillus pycnus]|uniref:toxic anion resistance protein n=1 Tax=Rummeliibacillus pycnus TaxID=101070 RepID=UPI003D26D05D